MQAGWTVVGACDYEAAATITYLHNLGAYPVQFYFATEEDRARLERAMEREYRLAEKQAKKQKKRFEPPVSGANFPALQLEVAPVGHFFFGDMRKFTGRQILDALGMQPGELDLVCGGPPCQGFSYAGKRNVMDPRNSLVFDFARKIVEMQPKTMVMENVPGIVNMVTPEGLPVLDCFCRILEDGGFGTYDMLKNSLLATAGAGAVVRGKVRTKGADDGDDDEIHAPNKRRKRRKKKEPVQLALV